MPTQTISASVDIAVPVAKVYAHVADLPRHVEWNLQPRVMTPLTEGPLRVGSRFETVEGAPSTLKLRDRMMFGLLSTVAPKWFSVTFDDCRRPGLLNRGSEQR